MINQKGMQARPILIVLDDIDIRDGFQLVLEGSGYSVILAKDAQMGLGILETHPIHELPFVILLELQVSDLENDNFVNRIRNHAKKEIAELPIILLSSSKVDSHIFSVQENLTKPIDMDALLKIISSYQEQSEINSSKARTKLDH